MAPTKGQMATEPAPWSKRSQVTTMPLRVTKTRSKVARHSAELTEGSGVTR